VEQGHRDEQNRLIPIGIVKGTNSGCAVRADRFVRSATQCDPRHQWPLVAARFRPAVAVAVLLPGGARPRALDLEAWLDGDFPA
jgi:uncharacterized protein (DUF849 family)